MPDVRLVDLEIIKRFSLAVRAEYGDADEVLAALDASRQAVLRALAPPASGAKAAAGPVAPKTAAPKQVAPKQVAPKPTAGKSSTARKPAGGKPSGKKAGPRKTR